jgi:hypothetical protein
LLTDLIIIPFLHCKAPNKLTMTQPFEPFTPEAFQQQTGMNAHDNEAVYVRWVNTQINYANFQAMREMTQSLKEIIRLLNENNFTLSKKEENYPFSK